MTRAEALLRALSRYDLAYNDLDTHVAFIRDMDKPISASRIGGLVARGDDWQAMRLRWAELVMAEVDRLVAHSACTTVDTPRPDSHPASGG